MDAVDLLVELASLQTAFLTLDEAIKTTNRRVNALEHVVKPKLENTIAYIKVGQAWQDRHVCSLKLPGYWGGNCTLGVMILRRMGRLHAAQAWWLWCLDACNSRAWCGWLGVDREDETRGRQEVEVRREGMTASLHWIDVAGLFCPLLL